MAFLSSISGSSTALLLLQPAGTSPTTPTQSATDAITATASGQTRQGKVSVVRQPSPGESKVAEAMFGVNHPSITKQKLDIIDRTAKALGVNQDDYSSRDDFVAAMQKAFARLKVDGGDSAVHGLEKELGLDKLGISLQDVIDSASNPEANDRLTKALKRNAGMYGDDTDGTDTSPSLPTPNFATGLYGSSNR
ncbi:hypothetical protein [Rhizobium tumorigenes]|uniref:Uncharacterized protein n=1 Tax=Rhizobium tumorigenes TaxID=2041385 RepID=A0AAF1KN83_9HYPH|nr:hypothetical protein [Rhizobium tumorigenes]WFR94782.1 hypothetical protein PR017_13295 [Rhizobium tumorigenes]